MNVTSIRDKVGRSQWRSAVCSYMQAMLPANLSPVRNSSRSIPLISRTHVDQEEDEQHPQADRSAQWKSQRQRFVQDGSAERSSTFATAFASRSAGHARQSAREPRFRASAAHHTAISPITLRS